MSSLKIIVFIFLLFLDFKLSAMQRNQMSNHYDQQPRGIDEDLDACPDICFFYCVSMYEVVSQILPNCMEETRNNIHNYLEDAYIDVTPFYNYFIKKKSKQD